MSVSNDDARSRRWDVAMGGNVGESNAMVDTGVWGGRDDDGDMMGSVDRGAPRVFRGGFPPRDGDTNVVDGSSWTGGGSAHVA